MLSDTELRLTSWRDGSTQAERLAAASLKQFGYEEIDPQAPLGGPDGRKDIVCLKGGKTWIGAVYFPVGTVRFAAIKAKFTHDLKGVPRDAAGIAFVTNQHVTQNQRKILSKLADDTGKLADIVHVERLRVLLDSPSGYGVRAQFLRIPMNLEEQLSWFSDYEGQVASEVAANTRELRALRELLRRQGSQQAAIKQTMQLLAASAGVASPDLISTVVFAQVRGLPPITKTMSVSMICLFHRLVCFDLPSEYIGVIRSVPVTVGRYSPPAPQEVSDLLRQLCEQWNQRFDTLKLQGEKIASLAAFHHKLLFIHPFIEGNGRAARAVLAQQSLDLFNRADMSMMNRGDLYYRALEAADAGNLNPLEKVIAPIVTG